MTPTPTPTLIRALRAGLSRAATAPTLIALLWVVNLAAAVPLAVSLAGSIHDSVDGRPVQARLASGWAPEWYAETFGEGGSVGSGPLRTFGPAVVGAGAFLKNLEGWWSGRVLTPGFTGGWGLLAAAVGYALLWALLLGGVIDHVAGRSGAGRRGLSLGRFLAAGGRTFFRFVRLAVLSGVLYLLLFLGARRAFGLMEEAARDVTTERTVLLWAACGAALLVVLLSMVRVVFDYAKIAVVTEDRRSALGAARAGLRFVASHPVRTLGLFWIFTGAGLALLWLYGALAPTAGPGTWLGVVLAFLFGQLALVVRLGLRVAVLGGGAALYAPSAGAVGGSAPERPAPAP